jgi:hypothetical protein
MQEIPLISETVEYDVMLETKMKDEALIVHRKQYQSVYRNEKSDRSLQVLDA